MQIKSIMSAAGSELCVTADSYSVVLLPCEPAPAANSTQLWTNTSGQVSTRAAVPG